MNDFRPTINGQPYTPGEVVEIDGPTFVPGVISDDLRFEWESHEYDAGAATKRSGNTYSARPQPPGEHRIRFITGGEAVSIQVKFKTKLKEQPAPTVFGAKNVFTDKTHQSLPRPTTKPDDDRNQIEVRGTNEIREGIEVVPGGEFVAERKIEINGKVIHAAGERRSWAGTGFQLFGVASTLRNIRFPSRFTGYAAYIRPSANGFTMDNIEILEGSEFEACIRLGGAGGYISRLTCISTGPGWDEKQTRTGIRGYTANQYFTPGIDNLPWDDQLEEYGVTIEDFRLQGVACGLNAMTDGDSGPLDGITHLMQLTTPRPMQPTWEGDWNRVGAGHPNAAKCVDAFLAGKAAGKPREQIVADCIAASGVSGPDVKTSLESRDAKFGQRAYARWKNGTMSGCQWLFNLAGKNEFINVDFGDTTIKVMDVTPQRGRFVPGHSNDEWFMPGDTPRPLPAAKFTNCRAKGKRIDSGWVIGADIRMVFE